jgi:hypothetical protein
MFDRPGKRTPRWVSSRVVRLPPPGPEQLLRPMSGYALFLMVLAAAVGLFTFVNAWGSDQFLAVIGLVAGIGFGVGGALSYRRCTRAGPTGLVVQRAVSRREMAWADVDHFDLMPHRPGRADRIAAYLRDGDEVPLIHQDSKSLAFRPEVSREFYRGLIDRLDTVRRTAGK